MRIHNISSLKQYALLTRSYLCRSASKSRSLVTILNVVEALSAAFFIFSMLFAPSANRRIACRRLMMCIMCSSGRSARSLMCIVCSKMRLLKGCSLGVFGPRSRIVKIEILQHFRLLTKFEILPNIALTLLSTLWKSMSIFSS